MVFRMDRTWTDEEKSDIVLAYQQGERVHDLALRHGCRTDAISAALREHGTGPHRGAYRRFSDEKEAQIAEEYRAGASTGALAAKHDCGRALITRIARQYGALVRGRGNQHKIATDVQIAEIVRLRQKDELSQAAIAQRLGVSQIVISRVLREQGLGTYPSSRGVIPTGGGYLLEGVEADDPMFVMANRQGYVLQHRLVMARALGRPLTRTETVHHRNAPTTDNRLENLQLRQGQHGKGVVMVCGDCGSSNIITKEIA